MFKRNDSDGRRNTADLAGDRRPDHVDTAEYTTSSTPDPFNDPDSQAGFRDQLFSAERAGRLQADWDDVQAAFVDDPRQSLKRADELVAATLEEIASAFAAERSQLEEQWDRGNDVSTEDLRVVLQRYRSFFNRLLSV